MAVRPAARGHPLAGPEFRLMDSQHRRLEAREGLAKEVPALHTDLASRKGAYSFPGSAEPQREHPTSN